MALDPDRWGPDPDLFVRAGSGDREALDRIVEHCQDRLLARIRLMMGPEARACLESGDVLQDVFTEAIRSLRSGDLRDERAFLRWVTAIARHHIVDEVRRRREQSMDALSSELSGGAPSASACVSAEEAGQRLVEALERLDPVRQRVVELRALEGQAWGDVARAVGRSEGAARKLYHRALLELGERLADEDQDGGA